jgi:hypothetical protein
MVIYDLDWTFEKMFRSYLLPWQLGKRMSGKFRETGLVAKSGSKF